MPKDYYYDDVKIIKKPFKKRLKNILKIFIIAIFCIGILLSSMYLSKALSVSNISVALVYGDKNIKIKKSSLYAVSLGRYDTYDEAEKVALGSTIQGASGYIWQDDQYIVIGNIYQTESDASAVLENLKTSNYNTSIFQINFDAVTLSFDNLENKQVDSIRKAIDFMNQVYFNLYNYSISFDKGESNNFAISSYISNLRGEGKVHISSLQNLINLGADKIEYIKEALIQIDILLDTLILKTIDNSATNYSLKYGIASVTRIKYDCFCKL